MCQEMSPKLIIMKARTAVRLVLVCVGIALGFGVCHAAENATEPEVLVADLNGDGQPEVISRRRLGADSETGTFFQIVVKDASDAVLWTSPEILDPNHPLAFGEWHFGISLPQLAGDVDRDGKVELIVPAPQSDVSPTFFRVLQWTGKAFEPKYSRALSGKGRKGAAFKWTQSPSLADYWVQQWLGSSAEGGWVVELVSLREGSEVRTATAVISAKGDGFELIRWIQPPAKVGATVENESPAAQGITYRARLSAADHQNSSGAVLKKVIDILRQDRANVHRGTHRDPEDQTDERFASAQSREALASMTAIVRGGAKAEARIIDGTPVVDVKVSAKGVWVEITSD
jgi:hypothetical protein